MSMAICSSGSCVLPARKTMSSSAMPASCAEGGGARIVAVGLGAVVLQRAGDVDALGRCAERAEALGRLVVLGGDEIDLPQHAGDERPDAAVAGKAVVAEPAVDDRDAGAVLLGRRDQIRPELQLGEHQQRRPHAAHRRSHGPTEIERAVEHGEVGVFLAGQLVAGAAGRRDDELPIGMRGAQLAQQRGEQIHFADADGVNPDARRVALAPRHEAQEASRDSLRDTCRCGTPARRSAATQTTMQRQIDEIQQPGDESSHAGFLSQHNLLPRDTDDAERSLTCSVFYVLVVHRCFRMQHCLYFLPLPQGQGSLRPTFGLAVADRLELLVGLGAGDGGLLLAFDLAGRAWLLP